MKEKYFVNVAFDKGIKAYIENEESNSFSNLVFKLLTLIYSKLDILNPFYLKDNVILMNNLTKYGMSEVDVALFLEEYLSNYLKKEENKDKVLKYVIDMFIFKKKNSEVSYEEEEQFLKLGIINKELESYYYNKINEDTLIVNNNETVNLEALSYVGINLTNIKEMDNEDINEAKNDAYKFFKVDPGSPNREEKLSKSIEKYKLRNELVPSSGYVNILLLMSVIVTSISTLIIFLLT